MAHEDTVYEVMQKLVIADTKLIAEIMSAKGIWTAGTSAYQNSYKALTTLTALNKLVKGSDYWKLPECKSEYQDHAKLLTQSLAEILKLNIPSIIFREITIPAIGLRPDSLILLKEGGEGLCFVLECVHNETEQYLASKISAWRHWDNTLPHLSQLFKFKIPHFLIATTGEPIDGAIQFNQLLMEVKNENHSTTKL